MSIGLYIACATFVVATNFSQGVLAPPVQRLVELSICRSYYQTTDPTVIGLSGDVAENLCKENPIQVKVAYLLGILETIRAISSILTTIPFGVLSDHYGRGRVLYAHLGANILYYLWIMLVGKETRRFTVQPVADDERKGYFYNSIPIDWIVLSGLAYLAGGGDNVAFASLFATVTDLVPNELERITFFSRLNTANYAIRLLSSPISAWMMKTNNWIPLWSGITSLLIGLIAVYFLPGAKCHPKDCASTNNVSEDTALLRNDNPNTDENTNAGGGMAPPVTAEISSPRRLLVEVRTNISDKLKIYTQSISWILKFPRNFKLCLTIFLVTTLAKESLDILIQYISKRYNTSIAEAAMLFTIKAAVSIPLYIIAIPATLRFLVQNMCFTELKATLWCTRSSVYCLIVGSLGIGFATTIPLLVLGLVFNTLGSGLFIFNLTLLKAASVSAPMGSDSRHEQQNAQLYSLVGTVESLGSVFGRPLITLAWIYGLRIGNMGLGLPFFLSSAAYMATSLALREME